MLKWPIRITIKLHQRSGSFLQNEKTNFETMGPEK